MKFVISVHSFVDLITNSSSEIFVSADDDTIKAVKKLINNVLKAAGSNKTCNDLFDIDLGYEVMDNETYDRKFVTEDEFDKIEEVYQEWEDSDRSSDEPRYEPQYDEDELSNSNIIVSVKTDIPVEQKAAAKAAAKTLSDLTGLFQIDASYG